MHTWIYIILVHLNVVECPPILTALQIPNQLSVTLEFVCDAFIAISFPVIMKPYSTGYSEISSFMLEDMFVSLNSCLHISAVIWTLIYKMHLRDT